MLFSVTWDLRYDAKKKSLDTFSRCPSLVVHTDDSTLFYDHVFMSHFPRFPEPGVQFKPTEAELPGEKQ